MAEHISVIVIDQDESSRRLAKELFKKIPNAKITAEAIDLGRGYELVKKHEPTIVILDLFPSLEHALKLSEELTRNFPDTTVVVTSSQTDPDVIIKAMRSGAREFLSKPLKKDELVSAVKNVVRWKSQKTTEGGPAGRILTVFGVKGGIGTTTIATNLAVTLSMNNQKSVILVDLNLQLGNAALFLDIKPKYSIVDVAKSVDEIAPNVLKDVLPKHSSGVRLLARPSRIEEAESISVSQIDQIIALLKSVFDYIIIDTNDVLDDFTLKAIDESDSTLMVSTLDLPSIFSASRCLDVFRRMGYGQDKIQLVINRCDPNNGFAFEDMKKFLKFPVFWHIPNQDYSTVINSINKGIPISTVSKRSKVSQRFRKLATQLNGGVAMVRDQSVNEKRSLFKKYLLRK